MVKSKVFENQYVPERSGCSMSEKMERQVHPQAILRLPRDFALRYHWAFVSRHWSFHLSPLHAKAKS
jgi:hypothetical protein